MIGETSCGCASLRKTAIRLPTVSLLGLSRSCGKVSQAGNTATFSWGTKSVSALARSCAARSVAAIKTTGREFATVAARYGIELLDTANRTFRPESRSESAPWKILSLAIASLINSRVIWFPVRQQWSQLVLGGKSKYL